jgi:hypothetical protein
MDILCDHGAAGEWVKPFQAALNVAIERNQIGLPPLVIDGRYGDKSKEACETYQRGAGLMGQVPKLGAIDSRTGWLLSEYGRPDA